MQSSEKKIKKGNEYDEKAFDLKVGKYTTTPVKTSSGYEIIYVTDEKEKASQEDVEEEIIETLANEKLSKDPKLQIEAIEEHPDYENVVLTLPAGLSLARKLR